MANHGVLIPAKVAAADVNSYNRSAKSATTDLDNGSVVILASLSSTSGEGEVWLATQPATSSLNNVWMVYDPEIVNVISGSYTYKGLNDDPQNFYNLQGKVFSTFLPRLGDIIQVTAEALGGSKSTNEYILATNGAYLLTWAAAASSSAQSWHLIGTNYISKGSGAINSQRITSYLFECVVE